MIGLTTSVKATKLTLHELGGNGREPTIAKVSAPGSSDLTTGHIPMPLVKNLLSLHESAAPGSVKGFAKSMFRIGLMDELLTDAVEPLVATASPSKRVDLRKPERLMEAFYSASFLQNEEAHECLVYSSEGRVVGMAQIGRFAPHIEGLSCTISNLLVSPKLDSASQRAVIRHIASTAKDKLGEATLLTPQEWGDSYTSHGFTLENLRAEQAELAQAEAEVAARDPVGASIMRSVGVSPVLRSSESVGNVVRCRWTV